MIVNAIYWIIYIDTRKKSDSIKPSSKAIIYKYPEDNIVSLKSIIIGDTYAKSRDGMSMLYNGYNIDWNKWYNIIRIIACRKH